MSRQKIMWTALPNGVAEGGDKLNLSVYVSVRLETSKGGKSDLAAFPDFRHWPERLFPQDGSPNVSFNVQFFEESGSGVSPVTQPLDATRVGEIPDKELWSNLFDPNDNPALVISHEFEKFEDRIVWSYPAKHIFEYIKRFYKQIGTYHPGAYPSREDVEDFESGLERVNFLSISEEERALANLLQYPTPDAKNMAIPASASNWEVFDFLQLRHFHRPRTPDLLDATTLKERQDKIIDEFDFHQMLSSLGDFPIMMRKLGLVHDLQIEFPRELAGLSQERDLLVQVYASWTSDPAVETFNSPSGPEPPAQNRRLLTHCVLDRTRFATKPNDPDNVIDVPEGGIERKLNHPMLALGNTDIYDVIPVDLDGAAIKLLGFEGNQALAKEHKTSDTPEELPTPSLRSGGFSVTRLDRASDILISSFTIGNTNNDKFEDKEDVKLYAEDLIRGHRIDVWDDISKQWHSLCHRNGTYTLQSIPILEHSDEGFISLGVTEDLNGDENADLFLQESLFHWNGWSLVAPRYAAAIDRVDEDPERKDFPREIENTAETRFKLLAEFAAAPGTLPRLRFGTRYSIRARAVDMAGNSLPPDHPGPVNTLVATKPISYGRFEPIQSPTVLKREGVTEAETVQRLVIRSEYDTNGAPEEWAGPAERHIVPPKSSQLLAEEHGRFDINQMGESVLRDDLQLYQLIEAKDAGSFKNGTEDPNDYKQPYFEDETLTLPYFPDPYCYGASFHAPPPILRRANQTIGGLPGLNQTPVLKVPFYSDTGDWPDAIPFRMRVNASQSAYSRFANGVLDVGLPPAEVAHVLISSNLHEDEGKFQARLANMALWQWIIEPPTPPSSLLNIIENFSRQGRNWLLTPPRSLMLVHAVKQPIEAPQFKDLSAEKKSLGQTFAKLIDEQISVHKKSTSKFDIKAKWEEPVDIPSLEHPQGVGDVPRVSREAQVGERIIKKPNIKAIELNLRHDFGDTKHRLVNYSATATTRFAEYFVERKVNVQLIAGSAYSLDTDGVVEGSESVKLVIDEDEAHTTTTYVRGEEENTGDYTMNYAAGEITRVASGNIKTTDKLEISYLVPPITKTSEPFQVNVPSSARPAAPKVLYIIPTFQWDREEDRAGNKRHIKSKRGGGWLRVYMERPWWSSGDGELLGVVLAPENDYTEDIEDPLKSYVTKWGMDPIWDAGPTADIPTTDHFPRAIETRTVKTGDGLTLEELGTDNEPPVFSVAGHEVGYDASRDLWYSDIEIDDQSKAYYPFVRLALARFQPNSIQHAELSRVVIAEVVQLAPDRLVSIKFDPVKPSSFDVTVSGPGYFSVKPGPSNEQPGPSIIELSLEGSLPGVTESELRWVPSSDSESVVLEPERAGDDLLWTGHISTPSSLRSSAIRLVIKEFEKLVHVETSETGAEVERIERRLVFAETVEIKAHNLGRSVPDPAELTETE